MNIGKCATISPHNISQIDIYLMQNQEKYLTIIYMHRHQITISFRALPASVNDRKDIPWKPRPFIPNVLSQNQRRQKTERNQPTQAQRENGRQNGDGGTDLYCSRSSWYLGVEPRRCWRSRDTVPRDTGRRAAARAATATDRCSSSAKRVAAATPSSV